MFPCYSFLVCLSHVSTRYSPHVSCFGMFLVLVLCFSFDLNFALHWLCLALSCYFSPVSLVTLFLVSLPSGCCHYSALLIKACFCSPISCLSAFGSSSNFPLTRNIPSSKKSCTACYTFISLLIVLTQKKQKTTTLQSKHTTLCATHHTNYTLQTE